MTAFEAIHSMREMTKRGETFAFSFMSFSYQKKSSNGIVEVRRAKLRSRAPHDKQQAYDGWIENYFDLDTGENRRFWQMLLISFNGAKIELK